MAGAVNPNGSTSISVESELARVAEQLRRVTVQVRSGPGRGSGVIWGADGLIVTNAHVATLAEQWIVLADGRTFQAEVIARDLGRDLASLKIPVTGLVAADVRDSSSLRTGELVVAMGNPMGSVGALATGILHTSPSSGWVQADIRLAPGNSGGPLADAQGRVIGINSMIANGLALAVSSKTVERFIAGEERPRLGLTVQPIRANSLGVAIVGLMVVDVEPKSAAHLSGVMLGDIVVAAGGERSHAISRLAEAIAAALPSGTLVLDIIRGGALLRLRVKLGLKQVEVA